MKDITVKENITIRDAMKVLDKTAEKCLIVVEKNKKILGTLTDGDLRRGILSGLNFTDDIATIYNKKPTVLIDGKYMDKDAKRLMRDLKIDLIPIIDDQKLILGYITWSSLGEKNKQKSSSLKEVAVIVMAGGKGTRMEPFTHILPKPLVPVHRKPIIEHIIDQFTNFGCNNFYLTLNYKAKILKAYFDELQPDYNISFVEEDEPMGTAGSLKLLHGNFSKPFFVTNCDIIIKSDYSSLYNFHLKGGYDITLVASAKNYIIPYGTCELTDDGLLSYIDEKPNFNFLINTGLYVLNPEVLNLISEKKIFDMTHLIDASKKEGRKVGVFPVDDDAWIDVGQWSEYQKAVEKL